MSFRLGIIGAGIVADLHADAAVKAGQQIAGFCDVVEGKARKLADKFGATLATTSVDELFRQPDMPAVVVATPNAYHKDMAIAALKAGKDVLLEKPMAMNVAECDQIIATAKKTKQIVQLNFVSRQSPMALVVRDFIEAGRLGNVYHAKASWYRRRGIPGLGRWFTTKSESGGGVLIDLGVHLIDMVLHMTSRPKALRASAHCSCVFGSPIESYRYTDMWAGPPNLKGKCDVEDAVTGLVRFDNGMTLELNTTWAANLPDDVLPSGIILFGDRGGCHFDIWGKRITLATEEDGYLVDVKPQLPASEAWPAAWKRQHELFAQSVENRTPPVATMEHGREVQAILDAMYESSAKQREVEIA